MFLPVFIPRISMHHHHCIDCHIISVHFFLQCLFFDFYFSCLVLRSHTLVLPYHLRHKNDYASQAIYLFQDGKQNIERRYFIHSKSTFTLLLLSSYLPWIQVNSSLFSFFLSFFSLFSFLSCLPSRAYLFLTVFSFSISFSLMHLYTFHFFLFSPFQVVSHFHSLDGNIRIEAMHKINEAKPRRTSERTNSERVKWKFYLTRTTSLFIRFFFVFFAHWKRTIVVCTLNSPCEGRRRLFLLHLYFVLFLPIYISTIKYDGSCEHVYLHTRREELKTYNVYEWCIFDKSPCRSMITWW